MSSGNTTEVGYTSFHECSEVSLLCPVEATVLGYAPEFGSGIFFTVAFGLVTLASGAIGIYTRTWTFCAAITGGLLLETLGYVGRVLLNKNPWNSGAFQLQICAIILAPTLICVSVYLTLKHIALTLNPSLSRFRPVFYPRIFLPADLSCLILQAIGGGLAAAGGRDNPKLADGGNNAIIAGIVLQVIVLLAFGGLGIDYFLRVRRYMASPSPNPRALAVWNDAKFRRFGLAVMVAYSCIMIRCVYRVAEMAGGWGNEIMQDEPSFLVLDTAMILVACTLLTIFHPGLNFPQMRNGYVHPVDEPTEAEKTTETTQPQTEASDSNNELK
jgi:hypothetical protein